MADTKVYGSKETLKGMGSVAQIVDDWAGKNVIAISAADLPSKEELKKLPTSQQDQFFIDAIKKYHPEMTPEQAQKINNAGVALSSMTVKGWIGVLMPQANLPFVILVVPDPKMTKDELVSTMTANYVKPGDFKNIPGDKDDWVFLAMAHEAGHLKDPQGPIGVRGELYAQKSGMETYYESLAAGMSLDPRVPEAARALYALGAGKGVEDHAIAPALQMPGEKGAFAHTGVESFYVSNLIRDKVIAIVNAETEGGHEEAEKMVSENPRLFVETVKRLNHAGAFKDDPVEQKAADIIMNGADRYMKSSDTDPDSDSRFAPSLSEDSQSNPAVSTPSFTYKPG
ncbi:MAG: hypothetical protein WBK77_01910 [Alphaproteobacteria bacterium]